MVVGVFSRFFEQGNHMFKVMLQKDQTAAVIFVIKAFSLTRREEGSLCEQRVGGIE